MLVKRGGVRGHLHRRRCGILVPGSNTNEVDLCDPHDQMHPAKRDLDWFTYRQKQGDEDIDESNTKHVQIEPYAFEED